MISSSQDVRSLGTILGVWAHPDDEVVSMCGILCAAVANGQTVACVTATRGEAGMQDESRWPARKLAHIRERELKEAYKLIGIRNHHFLDYPDGGLADVEEGRPVQRLASLIAAYKPDSIFTFGPEGMTGHRDHQTVSRWVSLAVAQASPAPKVYHAVLTSRQYQAIREVDKQFNFFFNIEQPPTCEENDCAVCLTLDNKLFDCKLNCLRVMPSQYEKVLEVFGEKLRPSLGMEAFVDAG